MLDLTPDQIQKLTIWANEKLLDILDGSPYDGDDWFEVDSSLPDLQGKIDVNIWDDLQEDGKVILRGTAYAIDNLPDGNKTTNCENWINLF